MASSRARKAATSVSSGMVTAWGRESAMDEQYHVNSTSSDEQCMLPVPVVDEQCHGTVNSTVSRVTVPALGTVTQLGLAEAEKKLRL
jgi:hypothetical protein